MVTDLNSPGQARAVVAEATGTALLLAAIVGSGIMGDRLAGGNAVLALLANSLATGAALVALILTFGPVSGAHFNPAVTLADASQGGLPWGRAAGYVAAQLSGAVLGVFAAHAMFSESLLMVSTHDRGGVAQMFSEFIATFGLLAVIWGCSRRRASITPLAVGAYVIAAIWFTASTSFANPAVTIARVFTDTFTGIHPSSVAGFLAGQFAGAFSATWLFRWLTPMLPQRADDIVVPHSLES